VPFSRLNTRTSGNLTALVILGRAGIEADGALREVGLANTEAEKFSAGQSNIVADSAAAVNQGGERGPPMTFRHILEPLDRGGSGCPRVHKTREHRGSRNAARVGRISIAGDYRVLSV
jgi:hypothetical protein